jgi:hypothetical protein
MKGGGGGERGRENNVYTTIFRNYRKDISLL